MAQVKICRMKNSSTWHRGLVVPPLPAPHEDRVLLAEPFLPEGPPDPWQPLVEQPAALTATLRRRGQSPR